MSEPEGPIPLGYESRELTDDQPLSIYPDPGSNLPFLRGIVVGTFTPLIAAGLATAMESTRHVPAGVQGLPAHLIGVVTGFLSSCLGVPILDVTLKFVLGFLSRRTKYAASFQWGLVVSLITGYALLVAVVVMIEKK